MAGDNDTRMQFATALASRAGELGLQYFRRLDTLTIEPGQTQRIAFLAEYPGRYLIESVATDWTAQRLVRWYSVA